MKHIALCVLALTFSLNATSALAEPFTYQGTLDDAGTPANGVYDFIFELYNSPSGGGFIAAGSASGVLVENGVFTVDIDIDITPENQDYRWIEISVRPTGTGPFNALSPRQFLSAAPFASVDLNEPWTRDQNSNLSFGVDTQDEIVLINRDFRIGAEYFGIGADTNSFAGMYAWTSGDNGLPFYGYSAGGNVDAYSYYDGSSSELIFNVNSFDRLRIGNAIESNSLFRVVAGADTKFFVDPFTDDIQIGDNDADTNISILGDPFVSGKLIAQQFEYSFAVETSITVLGTDFVPNVSIDGAITHFPASNLTSGLGSVVLLAEVDLPVGAEVQSMEVFVNDQTSTRGIDIQLRRRALNSAAFIDAELVATYQSSAPGFRSPTQGAFVNANAARVVRPGDSFYLNAVAFGSTGWPGAESLAIRGVRINYTVSQPD